MIFAHVHLLLNALIVSQIGQQIERMKQITPNLSRSIHPLNPLHLLTVMATDTEHWRAAKQSPRGAEIAAIQRIAWPPTSQ